ncbi:hypothetical protein [Natrinema sp. SYSU A 869]|uniref:hypothetical protein n=1 Tax=Natrinema sp. SYSU A 869 TaxID=2871694 RepID=UPI001CA40FC1|nr:hypothetical protein [Natrinema sp. SYSU A 869]
MAAASAPENYFSSQSTDNLEDRHRYLAGINKEGTWPNSDYTTWYDSTHKLSVGQYRPFTRGNDDEIVPFRISSQAFAEGSEQWGDGERTTDLSETIAADGLAVNVRNVDGASKSDLSQWIGNPTESDYVAVRNASGPMEDVDEDTSEASDVLGWGLSTMMSFSSVPLSVTSAASLVTALGTTPPTPQKPYTEWDPWPHWVDDPMFQSFVRHDDGRTNGGTSEISQYLHWGLQKPQDATVELEIFASTYQIACPVGSGETTPGYECADGSGDYETGGVDTFSRVYNIEV